MNTFIYSYVHDLKKKIGKQKRVLEIGSLNVNGSIKDHFSDADKYIGIDLEKGENVDIVASSYDIPKLFKKESFDCVICCETLEHDTYFWVTLMNMRWVLKKGGYMIISVPSLQQYIHSYPKDYWRFLPDAIEVFLKDFEECEGVVAFPGHIKSPKPESDLLTVIYHGKKPKNWKEKIPYPAFIKPVQKKTN